MRFKKYKYLICFFHLEYLKYAHGIVSEYLQEDISKKLAQHLNLPDETENKKRKLSNNPEDTVVEKKSKKETPEKESVLKPKTPESIKEKVITSDVFQFFSLR